MKCLSMMQPYAELVASGRKTIELRSWNTRFRGQFLIHASKKTDMSACKKLGMEPKSLVNGAIIGTAYLYAVKRYPDKKAFMVDSKKHLASYAKFGKSRYGFMLKGANKLRKPVSLKGMLNFFDFNAGNRYK